MTSPPPAIMTKHPTLTLLAILLLAAWLRLSGVVWDGYQHYHPDERYISWVATTIQWPADWETALHPHQSTLNPFYWPTADTTTRVSVPRGEARAYAYGHLPLYMGVAATRLVEKMAPWAQTWLPAEGWLAAEFFNANGRSEFDHLTLIGRLLTGLVDVATVAVAYWLGRQLYGTAVGLLTAALLASNVMHIQLAHFFTTDPYTTFFVMGSLAALVAAVFTRRKIWLIVAGGVVGLAIGSKFSAILLFVPLAVGVWLVVRRRWWLVLGLAGTAALFTFALTNPFALLDATCTAETPATTLLGVDIPVINWRFCYLENVGAQRAMVAGGAAFPFTRQYEGTRPFLYLLEMQGRWGMGWPLLLVGLVGWGWQIGRLLRLWRTRPLTHLEEAELVLLAWAVPYFLSTGNFYVKFMRYLQPITPLLVLWGAWAVWQLRGKWRVGGAAVLLASTALYALAFHGIYAQPHPWLVASQWLHENASPGAKIAYERWDEALPSTIETADGRVLNRQQFESVELTWLSQAGELDTAAKMAQNTAALARADYVVLASNRVYGVVPRLPTLYPRSSQYHPRLFDGSLGYEVVLVADRAPRLLGWHFTPDTFSAAGLTPPPAVQTYFDQRRGFSLGRADESFTVYDQPLTIILANTGRLSAEEMAAVLEE